MKTVSSWLKTHHSSVNVLMIGIDLNLDRFPKGNNLDLGNPRIVRHNWDDKYIDNIRQKKTT